ncbi:MAG: hypothetical protein P8016_11565 [Sedimentisphaerales bacterium]
MKNLFDILCERARNEDSPQVNVADKTLAIISASEIRTDWFWDRPLMWVAALSSATAVPVVIMAILLHNMWVGPLFEISQAVSWAM